ncbi:MAG: hypothetical protein JEZ03_16825 [Bacteroidales bacterium]|nr:hypothetical protein [Bacteroidales bacterium]
MKNLLQIILVLLVVLTGCKKEAVKKITISGISETNSLGAPVGVKDTDDWGWEDEFSEDVKDLFENSFEGSRRIYTSEETTITVYPNPCVSNFKRVLTVDEDCYFEYIIVDEFLESTNSGSGTYRAGTTISGQQMSDKWYKPDTYYRMYYKISYENGDYACGHGDILKK